MLDVSISQNILLFTSLIKLYNPKMNNNISFLLEEEKKNIIKYIKNHLNLKIIIKLLSNSYINQLKLKKRLLNYAKSIFVDTKKLVTQLPQLNKTYIIIWKNNKIIIKSNTYPQLLKRIKILIFIIEYIKEKICAPNNRSITIYLVLSKLEKKFPNSNDIISSKNVNSGYCNLKTNVIFIWRKEEVEKVLFHEMIHHYNFTNHLVEFQFPINFLINGPTNYYEAIADFWGIFYNLIYLSLVSNISVKKLFILEFCFIKNQALQLNNFFNLNWKNIKLNIINQNTAAFSYYILKYLLIEYLLYNKSEILFKFIKDNIIFDSEVYYIEYNNIFNKLNIIKDDKYIKINSIRMTLLELN